jgi:adenosylcobinamide-phosphate synthase
MSTLGVLVLAILIDGLVGDPDWLWRRIPHPAALLGRAIGLGDKALNTGTSGFGRRLRGLALMIALIAWCIFIGIAIEMIPYIGWILSVLLAAVLLAQRALAEHVWAVAEALKRDLTSGREAVAKIVGRDTNSLSEADVSRAAIESAAENFSDGFVAPVFWFMLFGLPGMLVYKAVNTADSMIGHRTPKHEAFGWAAARIDSLMNYLPARLTALIFLVAVWSLEQRDMVMRDAPSHRSWNAGWPEAAMAGVLGIALSGPRSYAGRGSAEPWLNADGRRDAGPDDIEAAVMLLWRAWTVAICTLCVLALLT